MIDDEGNEIIVEDEKGDQEAGIEGRARNMGWVSKEEFHGNPDFWKTAEDFVSHGEETLPILRERIRKMDSNFTAELEKNRKVIKEFSQHYKSVEKNAHEKAIKTLKAEQLAAVKLGDTDKYLEIEEDIKEVEKDKPIINEDTEGSQTPEGFDKWSQEHSWYGTDSELTAYADSMGNFIIRTKPGIKGEPFFNELTKQIKMRYPEKFENKNRIIPSTVEGDNDYIKPSSKTNRSYDSLPSEAKKICDSFVKEGLLTKEEYIKDYEWE